MSGGISDVLERVMKKKGKPYPLLHGGEQYSATKGSYTAHLHFDNMGKRHQFELVHYGTKILSVHFPSISSSGAINKALNELKVPCWWSRSDKKEGFWCGKTRWKGDPNGPKETKRRVAQHKARVVANRKARQLARPGGLFRKPGVKYSPFAIKKMGELQKDYLDSN